MTPSLPVLPQYFRGHVRAPNKDHLIDLSARRHANRLQALFAQATPPAWDSRGLGWVGPVKNQKSCGSCWRFSGVGVIEIAYNKAGVGGGPDKLILSEEYGLDCNRNGGCNGDDNTTVLIDSKAHGDPLSAAYGPYTAGGGRPGSCAYKPSMTLYKIDDWGFADGSGGNGVTPVQTIKNAIMAYGCVGCAVAAGSSWDGYSGGIYTGNSTGIDHDVILVGWQDDATVHSGGWWWMRNSWDTTWGIDGYMKIAYGADSIGTEAVWAVVKSAAVIDWGNA